MQHLNVVDSSGWIEYFIAGKNGPYFKAVINDIERLIVPAIAQQYQLAMADAMMYSIAQEHKALFWTQDVDYKDLPEVRFQAKV